MADLIGLVDTTILVDFLRGNQESNDWLGRFAFDEHFQLLLFQQVDRLLLTFASFAQIMRRGIRLPFGCGCIPRYVVIKFIHSEVV